MVFFCILKKTRFLFLNFNLVQLRFAVVEPIRCISPKKSHPFLQFLLLLLSKETKKKNQSRSPSNQNGPFLFDVNLSHDPVHQFWWRFSSGGVKNHLMRVKTFQFKFRGFWLSWAASISSFIQVSATPVVTETQTVCYGTTKLTASWESSPVGPSRASDAGPIPVPAPDHRSV